MLQPEAITIMSPSAGSACRRYRDNICDCSSAQRQGETNLCRERGTASSSIKGSTYPCATPRKRQASRSLTSRLLRRPVRSRPRDVLQKGTRLRQSAPRHATCWFGRIRESAPDSGDAGRVRTVSTTLGGCHGGQLLASAHRSGHHPHEQESSAILACTLRPSLV
jgi:hypothetical protein